MYELLIVGRRMASKTSSALPLRQLGEGLTLSSCGETERGDGS